MRKQIWVAWILALAMLFCACDSTTASGTDSDAVSGGIVTDDGNMGLDAVITTLADREDADAEYITTLKTYEMLTLDTKINYNYVSFKYIDGDYLYVMANPYPNKELYRFDRDGHLVDRRPVPGCEDGTERYALVLPDDTMMVIYVIRGNYQQGFLCRYDIDGTLLQKTHLPDVCALTRSCFVPKILSDEDGGFRVVLMLTTTVVVLDDAMNIECWIALNGAMDYMYHRGGDLFWLGYGSYLFSLDIGAQTFERVEENPFLSEDYVEGDLHFDSMGNPYYSDNVGIYALGEGGTRETVLEWLNGTASSSVVGIFNRERIVSVQQTSLGMNYEICMLDCAHIEEFASPRRVIDVGIMITSANAVLKEAISLFNAESEAYYIRLIDYDVYGFYGEALDRVLQEQILTGQIPDMLIYQPSQMDLSKYTSKHVFVDLDVRYGEGLLGGVRGAVLDGGRMWTLPIGMSVSTFAAARSVVDGALTPEIFYSLTEGLSGHGGQAEVPMGDGYMIEYDANGNEVWVQLLARPNSDFPFEGEVLTSNHGSIQSIFENGLYEFVDYEKREAYFDTDAFRYFIEYLRLVDEEYVHINAGSLQGNGDMGYKTDTSYLRENLQNGKLLLLPVSISNIGLYPALKRLYDDGETPFVLCGYPSSDGGGAKIHIDAGISVFADSAIHGGCAEFLDFLMSDRVQSSDKLINLALPVTLSGLSETIDRYRYFYYVRGGSEPMKPVAVSAVPLDEYTKDFAATYNIEVVITDEDKAAMLEFFENCQMQAGSDPVIQQIVEEELSFWYGGAKTLEETTKVIQSRVWIYLNE